jgi:rubrerythrin
VSKRGQLIEQDRVARFEGDYVPFRESGQAAKGSFRCSDCGYGVVVTAALPPCPMCGGSVWEESPWSPFSRSPLL